MSLPSSDFAGNIERFSGFADQYDQYRPAPPAMLAALLTQMAHTPWPQRVVDLGAGTGLSTRYWADKAHEVIGIEPTPDMRRQAEAQTRASNVVYREAFSHQTGLPSQCASIVTCSQALHWMEPQATFEEAARILLPGGVFAAYDCDWPPTTGTWQAEAAYNACMHQVQALEKTLEATPPIKRWDKHEHLARMQASRCFRFTKEIGVHHIDTGSAERLVGLLLSQGGVMTLLKSGFTETQLGLDRFRETVNQALGTGTHTWYWSYRVRMGIV
jgi:ubiquinone/menaquinone biosynthesis C-methylase UbiE